MSKEYTVWDELSNGDVVVQSGKEVDDYSVPSVDDVARELLEREYEMRDEVYPDEE